MKSPQTRIRVEKLYNGKVDYIPQARHWLGWFNLSWGDGDIEYAKRAIDLYLLQETKPDFIENIKYP